MRRLILSLIVVLLAHALACGYGFYNGSGTPYPGPDYWGWQCADGSQWEPDAGCPDAGAVPDGG
jgi:hypothetical protein